MINDLWPDFYMANIVQAEIYKKYNNTQMVYKYLDSIPENHYLYLISKINKIFYDFSSLKKEKESLESIKNLIEKYPTYTHLYIKLGHYYHDVKNYQNALDNYLKALSLTENKMLQSNLYYLCAQIYDEMKNLEKDRVNFEKSYGLGNRAPDFLNYYGYFLISNDLDLDNGVLMVASAVTKEPSNSYYLDSYGWALFKLGDFDKAITVLQFAKSLQPKNPVIADHLGDVYWNLNRKREAVFEWKKALSLKDFPNQEPVNFNKIEYKINYGL